MAAGALGANALIEEILHSELLGIRSLQRSKVPTFGGGGDDVGLIGLFSRWTIAGKVAHGVVVANVAIGCMSLAHAVAVNSPGVERRCVCYDERR